MDNEKQIHSFEYDGDAYEGEALDNVPHGYGKMTSPDGDVYEGNFLNGCFHGRGRLHRKDGQVLDGIWVGNELIDSDAYAHVKSVDAGGNAVTLTDDAIIEIYCLYKKADEYMKKGKYAAELGVLNHALRIVPDNPATLIKIGRCYRSLGLYDNAIETYKRSIEIAPTFGIAYFNLGLAYSLNEQWLEAIRQYNKALKLFDRSTYTYWMGYANYGVMLAKLGDLDKGDAMITEAERHGYKDAERCRIAAGIKTKK